MTGVLRTKTPCPSVLPTHTVVVLATTGVGVGLGGGAGEGEGDGTAEAATRATVGTTVGTVVDSAGGEEPGKPGKPPHALSTIARLLAPKTERQPDMYLPRVLPGPDRIANYAKG